MIGSPVFVDTNVLVYARLALSPFNLAATNYLDRLTQDGVELWISRQVLREYLATMTRPGMVSTPLPPGVLVSDVRYFSQHLRVAEDGPAVMAELLSLLQTIPVGGKQVHDANLVATMRAHGIGRLLTHNTADFTRYAHLITVLPLIPPP